MKYSFFSPYTVLHGRLETSVRALLRSRETLGSTIWTHNIGSWLSKYTVGLLEEKNDVNREKQKDSG